MIDVAAEAQERQPGARLAAQVDATPVDMSHTEPVTDFAWLQSKTGTELMTLSSDGQVIWWDIRMLGGGAAPVSGEKDAAAAAAPSDGSAVAPGAPESLPLREKGAEYLQVRRRGSRRRGPLLEAGLLEAARQ